MTPYAHCDLIDVLERVLSKGIVFEAEDGRVPSADRRASPWYRVSIAGVDVLNVGTGVWWRSLIETAEKPSKKK